MIRYADDASGIAADQLGGFFEGWPMAPSRETHLKLLKGSDEVVLAVDDATGAVVGFIKSFGKDELTLAIQNAFTN